MRRQQGFTYLGLIILVAVIGMVGAACLKSGALLQRAAAEEELLEIGAQFSAALKSYAAATPAGQLQQPKTLQDLLRDPRSSAVRRHLRKIFVDPVTGKAEWGVMYLGDKVGVIGVYSLSQSKPLKIANFDARFTNLDNKKKISDWKFMMPGQSAALTPPANGAAQPSLFGQPRPGAPAPMVPGAAPPEAAMAPVPLTADGAHPAEAPAPEASLEAPSKPEQEPEPENKPDEKTDETPADGDPTLRK